MEISTLLIRGLTSDGMFVSKVALGFVGFFVVVAIIVGFFHDKTNAFFCILIAISGYFLVSFANKLFTTENNSTFVVAWTVVFGILMVIRYLPCLSVETEKRTYLFPFIREEDHSYIVGWGLVLGFPALLSVGYYFLADWMVNNGHNQIGYVAITIFLVFGVVGFVKSFFDD